MNRLRKALSMDQENLKSLETTKQPGKKRFSFFNNNKKNTSLVVELPRSSISTPSCVENNEVGSPISIIDIYSTRPRSVHIDPYASNLSFTSSLTSNSTNNVASIHSNEIYSASAATTTTQRRRSTKLSSTPEDTVVDQDSYLQLGMNYHEKGELEKATHYWRLSAESGSPLGLFFYGIALRHGWGCKKNSVKAVKYLQSAAELAVHELQTGIAQSVSVAKSELVLAIYELGVCFRHGWGVPKNLETATYYFEVASNLGDPDAQNDLGFCYSHGLGVKKDLYRAAKYYRLADKQGQGMIGNSWIWKDKYNQVEEPGWDGKVKKK
ncbi:hypothetical protein BD770DRAFT_394813 [Pilaira anomala]|nr:hypothetical protein BD770DRAFT_394813 [Pilaira anomala]